MSSSSPATAPQLAEVAAALAQWRSTRPRSTRIPEDLWSQATELAERHGLAKVAVALKLDYKSLKRRLSVRHCTDDAHSAPVSSSFVVCFRQRCETPVVGASAAQRLIRGHGSPAPGPTARRRQPPAGTVGRRRSERRRLSPCRVSPAEVRCSLPQPGRGLRCSSRASRPRGRARPWPRGAAGRRGSGTARPCSVRPCGSGS